MLTPQTVLNLHTTNKDDVFRRQGELFALFEELAKQHGETEELMLLGLVVKVACELYLDMLDGKDVSAKCPLLSVGLPLEDDQDLAFANKLFNDKQVALFRIRMPNFMYFPTDEMYKVRQAFVQESYQNYYAAVVMYQEDTHPLSAERLPRAKELSKLHGKKTYEEAHKLIQNEEFKQGVNLLTVASNNFHSQAKCDLGLAYVYGYWGVEADCAKGIKLLRQAVEQGCAMACVSIYQIFDQIACFDVSAEEAERCCKLVADQKYRVAIERLEQGFDQRPVHERLLERAKNGDSESAYKLFVYLYDVSDDDFGLMEQCMELLGTAGNNGHVPSLMRLAQICFDGMNDDSDKDSDEKISPEECFSAGMGYLQDAIRLNHIPAIKMYGDKQLKPSDFSFWQINKAPTDEAQKERLYQQFVWYKKAADMKDGQSAKRVAEAYKKGFIVPKDDDKVFHYTRVYAECPPHAGCADLADLLIEGVGCQPDVYKAVAVLKVGVDKKQAFCMWKLHTIYRDGLGPIAPDQKLANYYLKMYSSRK